MDANPSTPTARARKAQHWRSAYWTRTNRRRRGKGLESWPATFIERLKKLGRWGWVILIPLACVVLASCSLMTIAVHRALTW